MLYLGLGELAPGLWLLVFGLDRTASVGAGRRWGSLAAKIAGDYAVSRMILTIASPKASSLASPLP